MMRYLRAALTALAATVGVLTMLSLAARHWWIADLANQFRLQYAAAAVLAVVAGAMLQRRMLALAALGMLAINAAAVVPMLRQQTPPFRDPSSPPRLAIRVVFANVWFRNHHFGAITEFVAREAPDVIVFAEVSRSIDQGLAGLGAMYPHRYSTRRGARTGLLLLSRWPILEARGIDLSPTMDPMISAALDIAGRPVHVVGVHPSWPLGAVNSARRNGELARIAALVRSLDGPVVLIGDFNATAYSPHLQDLIEGSGLRLDRLESGWQPTWPSFLPFVGIRIDHGLTSRDIEVRRFRRGSFIGSDHWPLVLDLAL